MERTFNILIYKDDATGAYWGSCPALKGCYTMGDTVDEVKANMAEAISLYTEDYTPEFVIEDTVTLRVTNA